MLRCFAQVVCLAVGRSPGWECNDGCTVSFPSMLLMSRGSSYSSYTMGGTLIIFGRASQHFQVVQLVSATVYNSLCLLEVRLLSYKNRAIVPV
jgi:hypothetical protein